jgi:hypothetical protein
MKLKRKFADFQQFHQTPKYRLIPQSPPEEEDLLLKLLEIER